MREARTLGSWVIALFLVVMFAWAAADILNAIGPKTPVTRNHLFEVFAHTSEIAWFEPTGRYVTAALAILAAALILVPGTRRIGAILGALIAAGITALVVQLVLLPVKIPVDSVANGQLVTTETDPSALLYLVIGLLAAAVILIVVHPGRAKD